MNYHSNLVWNALDAYINNDFDTFLEDPKLAWMIEWRDLNCPHSRVSDLLELRINQVQKQLDAAKKNDTTLQQKYLHGLEQEVINLIKEQKSLGVSGKRLLLETLTRTSQLIADPQNKDVTQRYEQLAQKLNIKYPYLNIGAGMLKVLSGILLYLPSLGRTQKWIAQGSATTMAGVEVSIRDALIGTMNKTRTYKEQLKIAHIPPQIREENIGAIIKLLDSELCKDKTGEQPQIISEIKTILQDHDIEDHKKMEKIRTVIAFNEETVAPEIASVLKALSEHETFKDIRSELSDNQSMREIMDTGAQNPILGH